MQKVNVRMASMSDCEEIYKLMKSYIEFYELVPPSHETLSAFIKEILAHPERGCFLVVEFDQAIVAFATLYKIYSTFQAKKALILNDFYVLSQHRGKNIGSQLLEACKKFQKEGDFAYMECMTSPHNKEAIQFYLKNNAKKTDWTVFSF